MSRLPAHVLESLSREEAEEEGGNEGVAADGGDGAATGTDAAASGPVFLGSHARFDESDDDEASGTAAPADDETRWAQRMQQHGLVKEAVRADGFDVVVPGGAAGKRAGGKKKRRGVASALSVGVAVSALSFSRNHKLGGHHVKRIDANEFAAMKYRPHKLGAARAFARPGGAGGRAASSFVRRR